MTVTIHVPPPLVAAFEGRNRVDLGVPTGTGLGDVLQAVFALYPKLAAFVAHERSAPGAELTVWLPAGVDSFRLRDGTRLYLVAHQPRRLAEQAA